MKKHSPRTIMAITAAALAALLLFAACGEKKPGPSAALSSETVNTLDPASSADPTGAVYTAGPADPTGQAPVGGSEAPSPTGFSPAPIGVKVTPV